MKLTFAASIAIVAFSLLGTGCASITGTTVQAVSVQARERAGKEVTGAACELNNNKGKWFVTTPGSTMITRSNDDLQVLCNKSGHETGRASVVSVTKGAMFGNIVFGGGIGAIVDHNSGAAYEYPAFFQVVMGETSKIDPPTDAALQAQLPSTVPAGASLQPVAATAPSVSPTQTVDERLTELKRRHASGLITSDIYLEQQRRILEAPR